MYRYVHTRRWNYIYTSSNTLNMYLNIKVPFDNAFLVTMYNFLWMHVSILIIYQISWSWR